MHWHPAGSQTTRTMNKEDTLKVTQTNLQKSKLGQVEVSQKIIALNKKQIPFVYFVQEPMVTHGKAVWQPSSCKRFGAHNSPRALIYTDMNRKAWFVESLSTPDIAVIQTSLSGKSTCLLYTSPSPRNRQKSRMPSSA